MTISSFLHNQIIQVIHQCASNAATWESILMHEQWRFKVVEPPLFASPEKLVTYLLQLDASLIAAGQDHHTAVQLYKVLGVRLSEEEVKNICFDLNIKYSDLPASGRDAKIRELVNYLARRQALASLIQTVSEARPDMISELPKVEEKGLPFQVPLALFLHLLAEQSFDEVCQQKIKTLASQVENEFNSNELAMTTAALVTQWPQLHELLSRQRLLLFVGADFPSAVSGIPSRQELANLLAARNNLPQGKPLSWVAQQLMRNSNQYVFTDFLLGQLNRVNWQSAALYDDIVRLTQRYTIDTVITTAYHDALRRAFQRQGVAVSTVVNDTDIRFIQANQTTILKLYGDWQQINSLVSSEQDLNALIGGRQRTTILNHVRFLLNRYGLLFLGHDLTDPYMLALLDEVAGQRFQVPSFAIWSGLNPAEKNALENNRGINILDKDPQQFLNAFANF